MGIGPLVLGAVLLIEGLLVAYYASPIILIGTDVDIRRDFVAAFGAQMFFLGAGLASSWLVRERSMGTIISVMASSRSSQRAFGPQA